MDLKEKSFDFAYEIVKQIISISTILLGVSLTFFEKFNFADSNWALITSWILFLITILWGLFVMMGITGSIAKNPTAADIYEKNITSSMIWLIIIFISAFGFLIFHTSKILSHEPEKQSEEKVIYLLKNECDTLKKCKIDKFIKIDSTKLKAKSNSQIKG
jgi:hypothetical protein